MHNSDIRDARSRRRPIRSVVVLILTGLLAACGAAAGTPSTPDAARESSPSPTANPAVDLFAYDADAPLDLTDVGTVEELGREIRDVTYASPEGGQVPAYIAEPTEDPSDVGIIMLPGLPEKRHAYLDPISRFACTGATAIVIDAPWARDDSRTGDEITFTPQDRDEQIQLMIDLRRAVDVLEEHGVDRIGFDGMSYGAAMGALLAGIEERIDAFALLVPDGGLVAHFTHEGRPVFPLNTMSTDEVSAWLEAMEPIEPVHFVGDATAPILIASGRDDEVIPVEDAEALHEAAGGNAEVRWYDAGHGLNPTAMIEHLEWLADKVGLDQDRLATCFEGAF